MWVSDQEPKQWLAIYSVVSDSTAKRWFSEQGRGLKEDPLLLLPKKSKCTKDQGENEQYRSHMRSIRGFQRVCMAGNLRQCEFR